MAGNNPIWTIDDSLNVVQPDGTIYTNPLNGNPLVLLGTGTTFPIRNNNNTAAFMNAVGTTNTVTAVARTHSTTTLPNQHTVIYGKRLRWTGDSNTFTAIPTAINRHIWFVNCIIEAEQMNTPGLFQPGDNNTFFLRPNGISATSTPSAVQLTENGASSVNFLGCTMQAVSAAFGPTVQLGYAVDNLFVNRQPVSTQNDPSTILIFPMNGGSFRNNTIDNTVVDVGSAFVRLGGNAAAAPNVLESELEGLTLARGAIMYSNRAASTTESTIVEVPNYNVLSPMVFSDLRFGAAGFGSTETDDVFIATTRTGSAGNALVGFRMRELENWEPYTYPVNGNRVTGRALGMRAGINGQEGNFRCVMTATYNPLFFDNAQAVSATERQAAGIPNVVTNITRGFDYGASGRTVDILNDPPTANNVSTVLTDSTGRLAGLTYNPNGTLVDGEYTGTGAGANGTITAGEGFITPYASLRPTNNGTNVNPGASVSSNGNNSNVYLYDTTFVNRSFTHLIGAQRELTTTVSPDAARAVRFDIFSGNQVDAAGLLYFPDTNLRPATVTMAEATDWDTQLDTYFTGRLASTVTDFETQDLYELVNYIHTRGQTGTVSFNGTDRQVTDFAFVPSTIIDGVRYADFNGSIDMNAGNTDWAWDSVTDTLSLNALSFGQTSTVLDNSIQGLRLTMIDLAGQPMNVPLIGDASNARSTTSPPGTSASRVTFDINNTMTGTLNLNFNENTFLRISDDFEGAITINNTGTGTVTITTATNPAEGVDPTTVPQTFTNTTELANRGITLGTNTQVETQVVAAIVIQPTIVRFDFAAHRADDIVRAFLDDANTSSLIREYTIPANNAEMVWSSGVTVGGTGTVADPWPLPDDQTSIDFLVSGVASTETYFRHTITRNTTPVGQNPVVDTFNVPAIGDESTRVAPSTVDVAGRDVHIDVPDDGIIVLDEGRIVIDMSGFGYANYASDEQVQRTFALLREDQDYLQALRLLLQARSQQPLAAGNAGVGIMQFTERRNVDMLGAQALGGPGGAYIFVDVDTTNQVIPGVYDTGPSFLARTSETASLQIEQGPNRLGFDQQIIYSAPRRGLTTDGVRTVVDEAFEDNPSSGVSQEVVETLLGTTEAGVDAGTEQTVITNIVAQNYAS